MMSCTESFVERRQREAKEFTERECPRMVDTYIRMDSMVFSMEPTGLVYYYTVLGDYDKEELFTPTLVEEFRSQLLTNINNSLDLRRDKEEGFTFTYHYFSASTGQTLIEASFGPEDYR
ncbi:MAG: hypothetical protein IJ209_06325 [Bacteroidaceae bacterium]|nr:hypothetical protein [Bacteroidaceae bacterium]